MSPGLWRQSLGRSHGALLTTLEDSSRNPQDAPFPGVLYSQVVSAKVVRVSAPRDSARTLGGLRRAWRRRQRRRRLHGYRAPTHLELVGGGKGVVWDVQFPRSAIHTYCLSLIRPLSENRALAAMRTGAHPGSTLGRSRPKASWSCSCEGKGKDYQHSTAESWVPGVFRNDCRPARPRYGDAARPSSS